MASLTESITTIAVTTAGVLLALGAIHSDVPFTVSDILEGRLRREDSFFSQDAEEDDTSTFLVLRAQAEDAAAAIAALYGEGLLTDLHLYGMNVG
jgi:hypothetical protein